MGASISAFFNGCPTVETMNHVNLTEWTRATWYVQEQQVTQYLSPEQNYCVAATYGFDGAKIEAGGIPIDPFYRGPVISVYNYANDGKVNGPLTNEDAMILCARVPDSEDETSKLAVAPCFLPTFLAGDYWILKAKEDAAGRYEWAIVIGGQPTEKMSDGLWCARVRTRTRTSTCTRTYTCACVCVSPVVATSMCVRMHVGLRMPSPVSLS